MISKWSVTLFLVILASNMSFLRGQENYEEFLENNCNDCKCRGHKTVAFQAHASKDLIDVPYRSVVKFDEVLLNKGGAYNSNTGKFTAPYDCVYSITWTVMTHPGRVFHTVLMVDNNRISRGYLDLLASNNSFSSTKTVLIDMKKGSTAWVAAHDSSGKFLWGGHTGLSSFSGHSI